MSDDDKRENSKVCTNRGKEAYTVWYIKFLQNVSLQLYIIMNINMSLCFIAYDEKVKCYYYY